jgi:DNA gyrase subunit A
MEKTTNVSLASQVQEDYLAYSLAVIVGRAIPSLTDGLKPSQRRVMTAMKWLGLRPDGKYMKSARVEGETMGKLHPHGGAYGVMVTLAAPWNNNLTLIDGQGNWGSSVDGAAASRYTESKLTPFSWDVLLDDSETWQTRPNYDGSLQEPTELNVKIPLVLLNGQDGIGVGFATRVPPHSLRDVCDAVCKGGDLTPSFPTGCDIVADEGLESYQKTGIGTLRLRARHEVVAEGTGKRVKQTLSFTNLPSNTNPEKIGQQVKDALDKGLVAGVSAVSDQSDLTGDRLTVTAKVGTDVDLLRKQLYHHTDLDSKYSARLLVVDGVKPVELSPSQLIESWKIWRLDRLGAKFQYELEASESRLEIVRGFLKAIDKIDAVIKIIRAAASPKEALIELVSNRTLKFTSDQARAILDMRLRSLTNLDSKELAEEERSLIAKIEDLKELIANEKARKSYMLKEVKAIGIRHGEARRSQIIDPPDALETGRQPGQNRAAVPSKPRFVKVDAKKGLVTQEKGPRGAIVVDRAEKLVLMTEDGTLRKVPSNFKGPISTDYSPVALAKRESEVAERSYLSVFILEGQLKAVVLSGEDLCRANSKGKKWMPEGAEFHYFGEGSYTVPWVSPRKRKVELFPVNVRKGRPGAKGQKVANVDEVKLDAG